MSMEVLDQESSSRDSSCSIENEVPRRFFLAIVAVAPFVKSNQNRAVSPSPRLLRFGGSVKMLKLPSTRPAPCGPHKLVARGGCDTESSHQNAKRRCLPRTASLM